MGWGCETHEIDEDSVNWKRGERKLYKIVGMNAKRDKAVRPCPICILEVLKSKDTQISLMRKKLIEERSVVLWGKRKDDEFDAEKEAEIQIDKELAALIAGKSSETDTEDPLSGRRDVFEDPESSRWSSSVRKVKGIEEFLLASANLSEDDMIYVRRIEGSPVEWLQEHILKRVPKKCKENIFGADCLEDCEHCIFDWLFKND